MNAQNEEFPEINLDMTEAQLEEVNKRVVESRFNVPDTIYVDLALIKDLPIGLILVDIMSRPTAQRDFGAFQEYLQTVLKEYQTRDYDTVDPYLGQIGYTDDRLETILANTPNHDAIFAMAPMTNFVDTIRANLRINVNNSGPAEKFVKKRLTATTYMKSSIPVTLVINTFPLVLSQRGIARLSMEMGETLGVNISFISIDPQTISKKDAKWVSRIDEWDIHNLGLLSRSDYFRKRLEAFDFAGKHLFARKRFEKNRIPAMRGKKIDQQAAVIQGQWEFFCEFKWIGNGFCALDPTLIDPDPYDEELDPIKHYKEMNGE